MAIGNGIQIPHSAYFPSGAFVTGSPEPVRKYSDSGSVTDEQDKDRSTGLPLWSIRVLDPDPEARKGQGEVQVKIASSSAPALPPSLPNLPFHPVEFEDLFVTAYVSTSSGRPRVAWSLRASGMKPAEATKRDS